MSNAAMPASSTEASIGMSISSSTILPSPDRFLDRLVPFGGFVGPLADPGEGQKFGLLVLGQVLDRRDQLFLDAGVDRIVEHRQRFLAIVVDILRGLAPVIVGRNLSLIFLGAKDDAAKRFERSQRFHLVVRPPVPRL